MNAEEQARFVDALRHFLGLRPMRGEGHGPSDAERFGRTVPWPVFRNLSVFEAEKELDDDPKLAHRRIDPRRRWQF